jgi:hypothetical protein
MYRLYSILPKYPCFALTQIPLSAERIFGLHFRWNETKNLWDIRGTESEMSPPPGTLQTCPPIPAEIQIHRCSVLSKSATNRGEVEQKFLTESAG